MGKTYEIKNPLIEGTRRFVLTARIDGRAFQRTLKATSQLDAEHEASDIWPLLRKRWQSKKRRAEVSELAIGTETLLAEWRTDAKPQAVSWRRVRLSLLMLGGSHKFSSADAEWLRGKLNNGQRGASIVARYMKDLRRFMRWLKENHVIRRVPKITIPKVAARSRGRPLKDPEVAAMRSAIEAMFLAASKRQEWLRFFDTMLESGLRIGEAFDLRWGESDAATGVVVRDGIPCFVTPESADKAGIRRVWPMTPKCWEAIAGGRDPNRSSGKVFRLFGRRNGAGEITLKTAEEVIAAAGEIKGIVVRVSPERTATAHELRRTFCSRVVRMSGLTTVEQMALMRHRSLQTTQAYYLDADASGLGSKLWRSSTSPSN